jgi:hypothetical protein
VGVGGWRVLGCQAVFSDFGVVEIWADVKILS